MEKPLKDNAAHTDEISGIKHDIRNQLSNINLAIEQLRYEITDASFDSVFYLDTIATSCEIINVLLKDKNNEIFYGKRLISYRNCLFFFANFSSQII